LCGLIFGTWASFIPYVKEKFILDEAQLGLLLLGLPVGNLIANPVSVIIMSHWGAVRTSLIFIVLMGIMFMLPVIVPSVPLVAIGLVLAGASFAFTNVAMNTCASDLEKESGLRLMSASHGMWSLGAMTGSLISGFGVLMFTRLSFLPIDAHLLYVLAIAVLAFVVAMYIRKDLWQIHEDWEKNKQPPGTRMSMFRPNRILWILISISLCTFLTEGTMADWSAVYLRDITAAPETIIGWGFGVYAFFMAGGRFLGDAFIARYGHMKVLMAGGILVTLGLLVIILSFNPWMTMPGFMLAGLGVSIASPILFAEAAKVPGLPPGAGLATMNTFGMAAFLVGPVLIGFIARALDLRIAFMFVAAAAVVWVLQTYAISRKDVAS
jgi:MFS family permease